MCGETVTNLKLAAYIVVVVQLEGLTTTPTTTPTLGVQTSAAAAGFPLQEPGMTHLSPGGPSVGTIGAMDRDEQGGIGVVAKQ